VLVDRGPAFHVVADEFRRLKWCRRLRLDRQQRAVVDAHAEIIEGFSTMIAWCRCIRTREVTTPGPRFIRRVFT
jgi:hypothetical protein